MLGAIPIDFLSENRPFKIPWSKIVKQLNLVILKMPITGLFSAVRAVNCFILFTSKVTIFHTCFFLSNHFVIFVKLFYCYKGTVRKHTAEIEYICINNFSFYAKCRKGSEFYISCMCSPSRWQLTLLAQLVLHQQHSFSIKHARESPFNLECSITFLNTTFKVPFTTYYSQI